MNEFLTGRSERDAARLFRSGRCPLATAGFNDGIVAGTDAAQDLLSITELDDNLQSSVVPAEAGT